MASDITQEEKKAREDQEAAQKAWILAQGIPRAIFDGVVAVCLILCFCGVSEAKIDEKQAVRAIVGEAAGEPYVGKVALAEAIRNRGTLKGVYGLNGKHVDKEPSWVWRDARRAWEESAKTNLVKGADHWESVDFKVPVWAAKMAPVAQYGKHIFYKEV